MELLDDPAETSEGFAEAFLRAPLFSTNYASGFGTLYTAVYRVTEGTMELRWPTYTWQMGFQGFVEGEHTEVLAEGSVA